MAVLKLSIGKSGAAATPCQASVSGGWSTVLTSGVRLLARFRGVGRLGFGCQGGGVRTGRGRPIGVSPAFFQARLQVRVRLLGLNGLLGLRWLGNTNPAAPTGCWRRWLISSRRSVGVIGTKRSRRGFSG